ncbi:hypothetical protein M1271_04275 [Patescibacteria group bacterium]|nr:hypothetical protein [Patescibacteria group bacterium]
MYKSYLKLRQNSIKYFEKHIDYNSFIHILGGIGIGVIITYPFIGIHPIRWGLVFIGLAILGHIYAMTGKK